LQRSYFYRDASGIHSTQELAKALEHFSVSLSPADLQQVYNAFPSTSNPTMFDFKQFAARLYPQVVGAKGSIKDGREVPIPDQNQQYAHAISPSHQHQQFNGQSPLEAHQHQQQQQQSMYQTDPALMSDTLPQHTQQYVSKTQVRASPTKRTSHAGQTLVKPRITANRPAHLSTLQQSAQVKHVFPHPEPYPSQEFKAHGKYASTLDKPRFNVKPQYETKSKKQQKEKSQI
jgi:hypothetical protein